MNRSCIESAASAWVARCDAGLTESEQAEFERWRADPSHAKALARHEKTWQIFNRPSAAGEGEAMMQEIHRRIARRRRQRGLFAGSAFAILLVTGLAWRSAKSREVTAPATVVTVRQAVPTTVHIVRQEQRTLSDGSVVDLKTGAEISVHFTDEFRRVTLLKGEAHFHVAKNKNRPFIVAVDDVEVRAVGTAFLVQREGAHLEVLVTEGIVAVDRRLDISPIGEALDPSRNGAPPVITTLGVGDRAVIGLSKEIQALRVEALDPTAIADQLAWRAPRLEFTGTPLSEAVDLLNEFNHVKIIVADPSIATYEVSGYFRADNTDSFLRLIEKSLGVQTERKGNEIFLRKAR